MNPLILASNCRLRGENFLWACQLQPAEEEEEGKGEGEEARQITRIALGYVFSFEITVGPHEAGKSNMK
jgi:hypothetical protein